jgi:predicted MFS family arabinose efflux permease
MAVGARNVTALAPLRHRAWRTVWLCGFVSYVVLWMQLVGAQWLMGGLTHSTAQVALLQTALGVPFFLVALPAGALGDTWDRRRLLITGQVAMFLAAAALWLVSAIDVVTPLLLLGLTAALGAGQAIGTPSWLAMQPNLLPPEEIAAGAALDGVAVAFARAVGPAVGGTIVALAGPATDFVVGSVAWLGTLITLTRLRAISRPPPSREPFGSALVGAVRYARNRSLQRILLRVGVFSVLAGAMWALLPTLARHRLHLDAAGYGILLACVGLGGAATAAVLPRLRARVPHDRLVAAGFFVSAAACADLAFAGRIAPAVVGLLAGGGAWVAVIALLDVTAQATVVGRLRARGLAVYESSFQGGVAISGLVWGVFASATSIQLGLIVVAAGLLGAAALPGPP